MAAVTTLNVTSRLHNLPVLYINKMVIIVGIRVAQWKHLLHSVKTPHSGHNLNKNCLENIRPTCFVFCYCFELFVSSDMYVISVVLYRSEIWCVMFRWSRGTVLAFRTQVRGSKPGRSRRIFKGEKILSTPSFGGEVKPSVLCRRFAACKRSLNGVEVVISAKLPDNILAHSSNFCR